MPPSFNTCGDSTNPFDSGKTTATSTSGDKADGALVDGHLHSTNPFDDSGYLKDETNYDDVKMPTPMAVPDDADGHNVTNPFDRGDNENPFDESTEDSTDSSDDDDDDDNVAENATGTLSVPLDDGVQRQTDEERSETDSDSVTNDENRDPNIPLPISPSRVLNDGDNDAGTTTQLVLAQKNISDDSDGGQTSNPSDATPNNDDDDIPLPNTNTTPHTLPIIPPGTFTYQPPSADHEAQTKTLQSPSTTSPSEIIHIMSLHPSDRTIQKLGCERLRHLTIRTPANKRIVLNDITSAVPVILAAADVAPGPATKALCALASRDGANKLSIIRLFDKQFEL